MLRKTLVALAATASLAVGAAALTPAMANFDRCHENPGEKGIRDATACPGNYNVTKNVTKKPFFHTGAPFGQSR